MNRSKSQLPIIYKKGPYMLLNKKNKENIKEENEKEKENEKNNLQKKQEMEQHKNLENYIEEKGLPLAFNVIFSELISKQIMPENFFTYTSLRLREIGKEIEGLKIKEPTYIDRLQEKIPDKRLKTDGDKQIKEEDIFMTAQHKK